MCFINRTHSGSTDIFIGLTSRKQEILGLLVKGLSYKRIADHCFISYAKVNSHTTHIYEKLYVDTAVEAVTKAIEQKIL